MPSHPNRVIHRCREVGVAPPARWNVTFSGVEEYCSQHTGEVVGVGGGGHVVPDKGRVCRGQTQRVG